MIWYADVTAASLTVFPNRPEKMAKLPVLLGNLDVTIDNVAPDITSKLPKIFSVHSLSCFYLAFPQNPQIYCASYTPDCITSSYIPMRNIEGNGPSSALLEVEEFVPCIAKCSQPFTIYNNHLYVYPKHLKYDGQKFFAKVQINSLAYSSTSLFFFIVWLKTRVPAKHAMDVSSDF